jgi:hypothetical protein
MPEINEKVMAMVEEELKKNPKISTEELYEKAQKIDPEIGQLNSRQFNARYPLQVKRRSAPRRPRRRAEAAQSKPQARRSRQARATAATAAAPAAVDRSAIRSVLLQFAKDVAAAEGKADVVTVIGNVDKYVDRVLAAAGSR